MQTLIKEAKWTTEERLDNGINYAFHRELAKEAADWQDFCESTYSILYTVGLKVGLDGPTYKLLYLQFCILY